VQVQGSYYAALPAALHTQVAVRIYAREIEILDEQGRVLRRHAKSEHKGAFVMAESDRIFNPSRETVRLIARLSRIGPATEKLACEIFARRGRPGQRAIYGLSQLTRKHARVDIETAAQTVLALAMPSYQALKRILDRRAAEAPVPPAAALTQSGADIRAIDEYHTFWEQHAQGDTPGPSAFI
jgi:hypothetical protein